MTNANYTRGRQYEYRVMRMLEAEGWTTHRMAGSHSQFDVIAWRKDMPVRFIQVKSGSAASKQERNALAITSWSMPHGTSVELWEFLTPRQGARITKWG